MALDAATMAREMAQAGRRASRELLLSRPDARIAALGRVAELLRASKADIVRANAIDVASARAQGKNDAFVDRLVLDTPRIDALAQAVNEVASLPEVLGTALSETVRPNGLLVRRVRVPIGVVMMVYESRPNVTIEAASLCLKAGNAVILRGGREAFETNRALAAIFRRALVDTGLPEAATQLVETADREVIGQLLLQHESIDLAIPRGGEALIRFVTENARIPVVQHYKGVCHMFLDEGCDPEQAAKLVHNAKMQRPGVCNALECVLVHQAEVQRVLVPLSKSLIEAGCELRACPKVCAVVSGAKPATDDDWGTEFLDRILAVKIVNDIDEAMAHIARYGSGHTEAIITPNEAHADRFRQGVDAACVVVNASTRFHDGGELGLGAEIGIATSRLHWRGAMGLESLTTMKWIVDGTGQTRA
jgi:glutamate-5-semialdehyde dehydrogenase